MMVAAFLVSMDHYHQYYYAYFVEAAATGSPPPASFAILPRLESRTGEEERPPVTLDDNNTGVDVDQLLDQLEVGYSQEGKQR